MKEKYKIMYKASLLNFFLAHSSFIYQPILKKISSNINIMKMQNLSYNKMLVKVT